MQYLNVIVLPLRKTIRSWRLTIDYCQLNSVVDPIVPAVANIVTVTESIAQTSGTWHTVLDIASAFFAIPLAPPNQE